MENQWITKVLWPPLQWQTNRKIPVFWCSSLTFYWDLFLFSFDFFFLVLYLIKINDDSNDKNNCVLKIFISGFDLIGKYFRVEFKFIAYRTWFVFLDCIVWLIWWEYFVTEMVETRCHENDYIHGFDLIIKVLTVESYYSN